MLNFRVNRAANNNKTNAGSALQAREGRESADEVDEMMRLTDAVLLAYGYTQDMSPRDRARYCTIAAGEAAAAALLAKVSSMDIKRSDETPRVS